MRAPLAKVAPLSDEDKRTRRLTPHLFSVSLVSTSSIKIPTYSIPVSQSNYTTKTHSQLSKKNATIPPNPPPPPPPPSGDPRRRSPERRSGTPRRAPLPGAAAVRARRRTLLQHGALHQRVRCLLHHRGPCSGDLRFLSCELKEF